MTIPNDFTEISISAASVVSVLALLMKWKRLHMGRIGFLVPWMLLVAGIGFAAAFLVVVVTWIGGFAAMIPVFGSVVMLVAAVVLSFIVLYDFWPRHPSNVTTEVAAVLWPAFVPEIGGLVGTWLATGLSWIAVAGATLIGKAFGV